MMKVLKFGAVWCSTCLVMKPRWEELENEYDWLETEYFDVDQDRDMAEKYHVESPPCFIFLNNKEEEIERLCGEISKKELVQTIKKHQNK